MCKIKYQKEEDNGKLKNVTEAYLVDAVSYTEAEARIHEELGSIIRGEFSITNITKSNINDVFGYDDTDLWHKVKVIYYVEDDNGNEKKVTNHMLVTANTVKEAYDRIEESMKSILVTFKITEIAESPIVEIFPYFDSVDRETGEVTNEEEEEVSTVPTDTVDTFESETPSSSEV